MNTRLLPIIVSHEFPGSDVTGDILEFVKAMDAYKRRYKRRFPAWSEALYVLRTLGYAKCVPGAAVAEVPPDPVTERSAP